MTIHKLDVAIMRHNSKLTGEFNSFSQFVKSADMAALVRICNLKLTKLKVVIEQCDKIKERLQYFTVLTNHYFCYNFC